MNRTHAKCGAAQEVRATRSPELLSSRAQKTFVPETPFILVRRVVPRVIHVRYLDRATRTIRTTRAFLPRAGALTLEESDRFQKPAPLPDPERFIDIPAPRRPPPSIASRRSNPPAPGGLPRERRASAPTPRPRRLASLRSRGACFASAPGARRACREGNTSYGRGRRSAGKGEVSARNWETSSRGVVASRAKRAGVARTMYRNATTMRKMKPNRSWPSISKWCGHWFASLVWLLGWFPPIADQRKGRVSDLIGDDGDSSRTPPARNGTGSASRRGARSSAGRDARASFGPNPERRPASEPMTTRCQ